MVAFLFLLTCGLTGSRALDARWRLGEPVQARPQRIPDLRDHPHGLIPASGDANGLPGKVLVWTFSGTSGYTDWSILDPVNQTFTEYRGSGSSPASPCLAARPCTSRP